jgi:methylisocitrate lyase
MTYLIGAELPDMPAGERFRALLARPTILQIPGAHNGMAALQARAAGFEAAYLSGAAMSASMGLPDLGIITVDEVSFFIRQVARASGLPVLVDGDTGYGEALNVMNMVRCFEDAGAAAVHIEDQLLPKKCGHLNDKRLAETDDMVAKVHAAVKARRHLVVIARTDAAASEGMDGAVARATRYVEAGADAIFPEALHNAEMFREFARRMPGVPLLPHGDLAGELAARGQQGAGGSLRLDPPRRRGATHDRPDADPGRTVCDDRLREIRGAGRIHNPHDRSARHAAASLAEGGASVRIASGRAKAIACPAGYAARGRRRPSTPAEHARMPAHIRLWNKAGSMPWTSTLPMAQTCPSKNVPSPPSTAPRKPMTATAANNAVTDAAAPRLWIGVVLRLADIALEAMTCLF